MILTAVSALGLLAGPDSLPAALVAREASVAVQSGQRGLGKAIASMLSADAVIVYPSVPVVVGRERVIALLAAQTGLDSLAAGWAPIASWISSDGTFAVTVGRSRITDRAGTTPARSGTYVAAWTRTAGEWWIAGLLMGGVARPGSVVFPAGLGPISLPPAAASGPAGAFIRADLDFAALAGKRGAPEAFRAYAAPDAIVLAGSAVRRGPAEIAAGLAGGPPADWAWYPVLGRAAASGDLGFTVGQSSIRPKAGGDADLGKYLTIWTRRPDGAVRFLTDGGNPRPKP